MEFLRKFQLVLTHVSNYRFRSLWHRRRIHGYFYIGMKLHAKACSMNAAPKITRVKFLQIQEYRFACKVQQPHHDIVIDSYFVTVDPDWQGGPDEPNARFDEASHQLTHFPINSSRNPADIDCNEIYERFVDRLSNRSSSQLTPETPCLMMIERRDRAGRSSEQMERVTRTSGSSDYKDV